MSDEQIDRLVRLADPYAAATASDLPGADPALLEEIMSTPTLEEAPDLAARRRHRSLRSRLVVGLAAASVLTAIAGGVAVLAPEGGDPVAQGPDQGSDQRPGRDLRPGEITYSAAAVEAAERNPRLLIDQPGWKATHVYGFTKGEGTIVFAQGDRELEMNWYPAKSYDFYYRDRLDVGEPRPITVAGRPGALFRYSDEDFAVMLEPKGGSFVELRTGIGGWDDKAAVLAVLADVVAVDVETWLAAMPPEIVKPDGARDAVAAMLADIPQPPGFDPARLEDLGPTDRYQLGAQVTGRVTCGWIEEWQRADRAGDAAGARAAVEALQTSRDWKILREMDAEGDFPEVVWEYAVALASGVPVGDGKVLVNGTPTTAGHAQALGCD